MPRLAIIADDLTGALDAAAPFAAVPGGVVVASRPDAVAAALATRPGVLAVSTRSREIAPEAARQRVARVVAALPAGVRLFKKVDSRLKGNLAAELEAFGPRPLLAAPAIPEFGRLVRDGALEGFGVERPIAVRAMLGPFAADAIVPDILSTEDFMAALDTAPPEAILLGARGLAAALAETFSLRLPCPLGGGGLERPLLIIVGSTDPITQAQVARLRAGALPADLAAPDGEVPPPRTAERRPVMLIRTTAGTGAPADPALVATRFAAGVAPWVDGVRSIVLTGGATAEAVFDTLGQPILRVEGEALPGMPLVAAGGRRAITKSGGFGAPDCLVELAGAVPVAQP